MIFFSEQTDHTALTQDPDCLFVFDDYIDSQHGCEQHSEMSKSANFVGIPTMLRPGQSSDAFLSDAHFEIWKHTSLPAWRRLFTHAARGGCITWPKQGIGTGCAELYERAPRIAASLERNLDALANKAKFAVSQHIRTRPRLSRKPNGNWDIDSMFQVCRTILTSDRNSAEQNRGVAEIQLRDRHGPWFVCATTEGFEEIEGVFLHRAQIFREPQYFLTAKECELFAFSALAKATGQTVERICYKFDGNF